MHMRLGLLNFMMCVLDRFIIVSPLSQYLRVKLRIELNVSWSACKASLWGRGRDC